MFRFSSCTFNISQYKEKAARAFVFQRLQIPFSYTFESSVGSYYENGVNYLFTKEKYEAMGEILAKTTLKFLDKV